VQARAAESRLDEVFFALSHPARRLLLTRLGDLGDQCVAPLSQPLRQSAAQITKHLAILERAGLISRRIEGREHRLHLEPDAMRPALDWVTRHRELWGRSLDQLEEFLDSIGEGRGE
jgi:DNA-binding transcriptional ArsR family regulator